MIIFLQIFIVVCIFIIGSLFGSFFSLATYRIPRGQDIIATRSYCPNCKHRLGFFDLIPVLSYIIRGAKCKYCKKTISPRYFLLEVSNGIIFVIGYFIFGYTFTFLIVALIYAVMFVIIGSYIMSKKMTDEEKVKIYNEKNNKKVSKKAGVFLSELVIAVLLFVVLLVTAFIMSRNYNNKNAENIMKSHASSIAIKNIEMCLATNYDSLNSYTLQEIKNNITYNVTVNVTKVSDEDSSKDDIVKKINVKVVYMYDGAQKEVSLSTLKGKVV